MMIQKLDEQLEQLFVATNELGEVVSKRDPNVDRWEQLLERREHIMQDIEILVKAGAVFSTDQKKLLAMMNGINQGILSEMNLRKEDLKNKIEKIQQNKNARQFYNSGGTTAYGAFFDRKN